MHSVRKGVTSWDIRVRILVTPEENNLSPLDCKSTPCASAQYKSTNEYVYRHSQ